MGNKGQQRGAARLERINRGGAMGGRRRGRGSGASADFLGPGRLKGLLGTAFGLDIACGVGLMLFLNCVNGGAIFSFSSCGGLELLITSLRMLTLPVLCYVGATYGKAVEGDDVFDNGGGGGGGGATSASDHRHDSDAHELEDAALLGMEEAHGPPALSEAERALLERRAWWAKNGSIGAAFVITTGCQVALGVKAILAPLDPSTVNRVGAQAMLCLCILWCNMELYFAKRLIESLTAETGVFVATSHSHRMFLRRDLGWTMCDRCHQRIRDSTCYNCGTCDWDVCMTCLRADIRKEDKQAAEAEAAGAAANADLDEEQEVTALQYMKRGALLLRPHWMLVSGAICCLALQNAASVMLPSYTGKILDSVIPGHDNAPEFRSTMTAFIIINVALGVVSGMSRLMFAIVSQRMEVDLRRRMFARILGQTIDFFDNATTGDLIAKLNDDVRNFLSPVAYSVPRVFGAVLTLAGGLVMCLRTSWRLSLLAFTILGPLTVVTGAYSKWAAKLWSRMWGIQSTLTDTAKESFTNIRTIRNFAREDYMLEQYSSAANERLKIGLQDAWASGGSATVTQYMELALQALVLSYGGLAILSGSTELSIGSLITFQLYWAMLSGAFNGISDQINSFVKAAGAAQRVIRLLDTLPDVDPEAGTPIKRIGDIELQNVKFRYSSRKDNVVLKDVSLRIPRGSVVALVGRSGGGKSTIVSLLCRAYDPESGAIVVDGHDLRNVRQKDYRKLLGIVQQDTELFNESIERNITFGVDNYTHEELMAAAKKSNCYDFIMAMEEGFATKVGERGVKLSGGQKQRISIARVMMKKPELLLLDGQRARDEFQRLSLNLERRAEATSALDSESEAAVQEALDLLIRDGNVTVVLVAHRLSTVMNAHKICVIDKGTVVESGTHTELLDKNGVYAQLVKRQVTKLANTLNQDGTQSKAATTVDELFDDLSATDKGKEEGAAMTEPLILIK